MRATPAAVLRSSSGRTCMQPAEACPVKEARAPCAATRRWKSSTKSASRSGATAVSSTNDAGRSAPGAPMSSGRTARRSAAGLGERRRVLQPGRLRRAELAGERAQAGEPGARLVLAALVLDREHGLARRRRAAAPCAGRWRGWAPGAAASRSSSSTADGPVSRMATLASSAARSVANVSAAPTAPRRARVERHLDLGEQRQRALGAGQQPARLGSRREQLAQVVAGRAAPRLREAGGDRLAVPLADAARAPPRASPPPGRARPRSRSPPRRRRTSRPRRRRAPPETRSTLSLVSP